MTSIPNMIWFTLPGLVIGMLNTPEFDLPLYSDGFSLKPHGAAEFWSRHQQEQG